MKERISFIYREYLTKKKANLVLVDFIEIYFFLFYDNFINKDNHFP